MLMQHPSCPKCKTVYKKKDMVARLGGLSNVRGRGLLTFKCGCGQALKMHYIEPTKRTAFFLLMEEK